ncbi:MAG: transposase [Betaproteobacteria bacterium]|nr:transposase [Betaproteobacteria bacterium]
MLQPGASVAGIAMANGVNANQVRRWMRERGIEAPKRRMLMSATQPEFVQLPLAPAAPASQDIYQVEREVADLEPDERRRIRQEQAKPILDEFHDWLTRHRLQVPMDPRRPKRLITASNAGRRSPNTSVTLRCRSTTTGSRTASGPLRRAGRTGYSPAACVPANGPPS